MTAFVTRFAPSPTGLLHLGHAFSAWLAHDAARAAGGRFLLRIEDIDRGRCRPEFETQIIEDLRWLGLEWDEPPRRQSEHLRDYEAALETLKTKGVVYRCFKTRKEVLDDIARAPHDMAGSDSPAYVGAPLAQAEEERLIASGAPFAWRLSMATCEALLGARFKTLTFLEEDSGPDGEMGEIVATPDLFGDAIVARKDIATSYHLACVWDDALQGVSHVIRGTDLFTATHLHRLLQDLLDLPSPRYRHHRLITDDSGARFAKRDRSVTLKALREAGETPQSLRRRVGLD